jgi:ABC-type sugar transport system ATPase subunit
MAQVKLRDVRKRYRGARSDAVKGISFDIEDGELLVILGPSGCGKTSTLRMIAGLEDITGGTISFDGKVVNSVPPARRNVAMAFENYGLYEHWSVFDNIAYPLRLQSRPADEIRRKVRQVAEQMQITTALQARPGDLSGGLRQRIGLARALVRDPSVFLLDEPMSHVDADLRNELRAEIKRIHLEVGSTMIIVTHDQLDALTMADRILVMDDGHIEQLDTPAAVYDTPATAFVAGFIGEPPMNLVAQPDGTWTGFRPHLAQAATAGPDDLQLDAIVYMVEPLGDRTLVTARAGEELLKIDLSSRQSYVIDQSIRLAVRRGDLHRFGADGRRMAAAVTV